MKPSKAADCEELKGQQMNNGNDGVGDKAANKKLRHHNEAFDWTELGLLNDADQRNKRLRSTTLTTSIDSADALDLPKNNKANTFYADNGPKHSDSSVIDFDASRGTEQGIFSQSLNSSDDTTTGKDYQNEVLDADDSCCSSACCGCSDCGPMALIEAIQVCISGLVRRFSTSLKCSILIALAIAYHIWLVLAIFYNLEKASNMLTLTAIAWAFVLYTQLLKPLLFKSGSLWSGNNTNSPTQNISATLMESRAIRLLFYCFSLGAIATFIVWDTWHSFDRLIGVGGFLFFFLVLCLFSKKPTMIKWRPVVWGFILQFLFGLAVLRWDWGSQKFITISNTMIAFLDFTKNGTDFTYGFLSSPPNICGMEPVIAFQSLQVVVYFGAIVALLYYYGIVQAVLKRTAWLMQMTMGTTATESLNACACVLLGNAESPMLIRPYLEKMTSSELHAVMTTGFACISGSVFAAYISFGACPRYLLSGAVMSAPGSLACSKLIFPETEQSHCRSIAELELPPSEDKNPLDCISNGAMLGAHLLASILANLVVFMGLLALANGILQHFGELIGYPNWSIELMLAYIFFPVAYMIGVVENPAETFIVARLLGVKLVVNDFIAYKRLSEVLAAGLLSPRSAMIATYALCSFCDFIAAGVQLAVLGGMAPGKKKLFPKLVLRAMLAGNLSCLMTASLAGILVNQPTACKPQMSTTGCFNLTTHQSFLDSWNLLGPSPSSSLLSQLFPFSTTPINFANGTTTVQHEL